MKIAETCACGAQISIEETYHHPNYIYEKRDEWLKRHELICQLQKRALPTATLSSTMFEEGDVVTVSYEGAQSRQIVRRVLPSESTHMFGLVLEPWVPVA